MIFTSYFANVARIKESGYANYELVNISRYPPMWFKGMVGVRSYRLLAPSEELFKDYMNAKKRCNNMPWEEYTMRFNDETLSSLNFKMVYHDLICGTKDVFLLCHEPPYEHCHRRLVADWLETNLGEAVNEWSFR